MKRTPRELLGLERVHAEHVGAPVADEAFRCERPAPGTHGHVKRTPRQLPPSPGGLERVHAERVGAPVVDEAFQKLQAVLG